ncbi:NAD-dependent epimerase/dehydratase family protein [Spirochaetia bacterium 38H-sp]|uniref:NAD-dependent epimerase/dehydratase family protein n=1 Tax=Rarispira pelagica TaxID=3141764 RepID=A0ABU9U9K8_9SPIR
MNILITGTAGFVGFGLVDVLTSYGHSVIGLDNINDYYDTSLKKARLEKHGIYADKAIKEGKAFSSSLDYLFYYGDICDTDLLIKIIREHRINRVVHLAAQAGVRYSLENPAAYIHSNMQGFFSVLEACRVCRIERLVYASSSSVYGLNSTVPFSEKKGADHPVSLYAATKRSNELMAHTYSHLYGLPTIGLRFFTVYGPWGRPDMAYFSFVKKILAGEEIEVFNNGNMERDFTYIDDIVEGVARTCLMDFPYVTDSGDGDLPPDRSIAPFRVYNIGHGSPVALMDFIRTIESALGKKAKMVFREMQPGDVVSTHADTTNLEKDFSYRADTELSVGIRRFVDWYRDYYGI